MGDDRKLNESQGRKGQKRIGLVKCGEKKERDKDERTWCSFFYGEESFIEKLELSSTSLCQKKKKTTGEAQDVDGWTTLMAFLLFLCQHPLPV